MKIQIDKRIDEKFLIENLLNLKNSGFITFEIAVFTIGIYAMKKKWHYKKVVYYTDLIKETENSK